MGKLGSDWAEMLPLRWSKQNRIKLLQRAEGTVNKFLSCCYPVSLEAYTLCWDLFLVEIYSHLSLVIAYMVGTGAFPNS